MSECRICKGNGKPGIQITFSDKIRSNYSNKMIPLETDGSTYHKHYEPTAITNGNGGGAPAAGKITPINIATPSATTATVPPKQSVIEDPALEQLVVQFRLLLQNISEYLKQQQLANHK